MSGASPPRPLAPRNFQLLTFCLVTWALAVSCGSAQRPIDHGPRGTLRLSCEPGDAILEVDETRMGPISMFREKGMLLKPGTHRIIVSKDGFFPLFKLVEITQDTVLIEEIKLRPIPE